jgi:hypothetical protein
MNRIFGIEYTFPKDYFRIVNRFMKEVGLYKRWKDFLQCPATVKGINGFSGRHTNWQTNGINLVGVLGKTNFTDYLEFYCKDPLPSGVCSYELFAAYLSYFEPIYINSGEDRYAAECGRHFMTFDVQGKQVWIN